MHKFLKLTELVDSGTKELTVWVNASNVASFKVSKQGRDTIMSMHDGKYFFIKQSPDMIAKMLGEAVING